MKRDQRFVQGIYEDLKNPQKYLGDKNNIIYRSSPERRFILFCDNNENVLQWSSEEVVVKYFNPIKKTTSRYFIDFYIHLKGDIKILIEYKPSKEVRKPKKNSKNYSLKVATYIINETKWASAKIFAEKNNLKFIVMTEKDFDSNSTDKKILEALAKVLKSS